MNINVITLSFALISVIILSLCLKKLMNNEPYKIMSKVAPRASQSTIPVPLSIIQKVDGIPFWGISRSHNYLLSISGLIPGSFAEVSFNDFYMALPVDSSGTMYWNNKHEPLPVGCIPYNELRITNLRGGQESPYSYVCDTIENCPVKPVGNYVDGPVSCGETIDFTFDLTYASPPEHKGEKSVIGYIRRVYQIADGKLVV